MKKIILLILFTNFIYLNEPYGGYVLYTPGGMGNANSTSYLRDVDGSVFNSWTHSSGPASMPYLHQGDQPGFENTLLYYPCRSSNPTMETGGVGGKIEIYNWEGDLLWSYEISNETYQHHHDIDVLPNGNILAVAWKRLYLSEWQALGRTSVNNSLNQMWTTVIFEIEPNFNTGGSEVVWEWNITDHLVQDRSPSYSATYGNISEHPELMDVNCGNVGSSGGPGGQANGDWMHVNAIDYNTELDQIAISSRFQNEIYIIDHSTTTAEAAGHTGGNSGMGGDFLYRWGNPQNYDRGNNSNQILDAQHSVNWIESGSPGEGNLVLFNNNHNINSSAALEFTPPLNSNGTYDISGSSAFGPNIYTWIHQGGFHSDVQSGAFRQPNGNTLITDANSSDIFEVSYDGEIVWEYSVPGNNMMVPRAQKYGYDYFDSTNLSGDLNEDDVINVLDIIASVNLILTGGYNNNADLNQDGIINVLDIVNLVNIILNN